MPALYIQNFPEDTYAALKREAKQHHTSMSALVIDALSTLFPSDEVIAARWAAHRRLSELQKLPSPGDGPFPTAEEMIREDRQR